MAILEVGQGKGIPVHRLTVPREELVQAWQSERPRLHRAYPSNALQSVDIPLYSVNGEITPQGWLISKVILYKKQLRDITQQQADEVTAAVLDAPRSWAVLFRIMTNASLGSLATRQETFERFLLKPEYFFGNTVQPLITLATRVDALKKSDWEKLQEEVDKKHREEIEGNQLGILDVRPTELTKIVRQAFIVGSDYASNAVLGPSRAIVAQPGYREFQRYDTLISAGLAAVETLHADRLTRSGHNFFYSGLFTNPTVEIAAKTENVRPLRETRVTESVGTEMPVTTDPPPPEAKKPLAQNNSVGRLTPEVFNAIRRRRLFLTGTFGALATISGVLTLIRGGDMMFDRNKLQELGQALTPGRDAIRITNNKIYIIQERIRAADKQTGLTKNSNTRNSLVQDRARMEEDIKLFSEDIRNVQKSVEVEEYKEGQHGLRFVGNLITSGVGIIATLVLTLFTVEMASINDNLKEEYERQKLQEARETLLRVIIDKVNHNPSAGTTLPK